MPYEIKQGDWFLIADINRTRRWWSSHWSQNKIPVQLEYFSVARVKFYELPRFLNGNLNDMIERGVLIPFKQECIMREES